MKNRDIRIYFLIVNKVLKKSIMSQFLNFVRLIFSSTSIIYMYEEH
jgi:hypothetical protein